MNWNDYPNFSKEEFDCKHSGKNEMKPDFMAMLQDLRTKYGKPMRITSGYRHESHPIEAKKDVPGTHAQGIAADIKITNAVFRLKIVEEALRLGFTGIGVASDFIHVDTRGTTPVMWTY